MINLWINTILGIGVSVVLLFNFINVHVSQNFTKSYSLWLVDILIPITFLTSFGYLLKNNRYMLVPPLGIQVFLVCLLGLFLTQSDADTIEFIQLFLYVYGTWLTFNFLIKKVSFKRPLFFLLSISLVINLLIGLLQVFVVHADNYFVRGLNSNYHIFSSLIVISFLYVMPTFLIQKNKLYKWIAVFLGLAIYFTVQSPPALIAILVGCFAQVLIISLNSLNWKNSSTVLVSLVGIILMSFAILIKPENITHMAAYFLPYESKNVDDNFSRIQDLITLPQLKKTIGKVTLTIEDPTLPNVTIHKRNKYFDLDDEKLISQRLVERVVSLNMAQTNPAIGVGLGRYQEKKDVNFGSVVKVNTTEPFAYSSLATALGTGGVVFLIGIMCFIIGQIYNLKVSFDKCNDGKSLLIGAMGSAAAFVTLAFQIEVFIAPLLFVFIAISTVGVQDFSWNWLNLQNDDHSTKFKINSEEPTVQIMEVKSKVQPASHGI